MSHLLSLRGTRLVACWMIVWLLGALSQSAMAHGVTRGDLVLDHPYAVPSLAGVANGSTYFRGIKNLGDKPDRLVSASTPVAERIELHRMTLIDGVMRMREVPGFELPAGKTTNFKHGGEHHMMLMNLKQALKEGDRFDLTLSFERAGTLVVKVWVQTPRNAATDAAHRH